MPSRRALPADPLLRTIASALLGVASFGYCAGVFLSIQRHLDLAPTRAVAVGRVTVEQASKLQDYLSAALFFLIVGVGAALLRPLLGRFFDWVASLPEAPDRDRALLRQALLFFLPFAIAPFFFLTTRKEGWAVVLPPILALAACRAVRSWRSHLWLRELSEPKTRPFLALVVAEATAWIVFRYLVTGARIAHIPTLFLELIFIAFFLALTIGTAILLARMLVLLRGWNMHRAFAFVASCGFPLLLLPFFGLALVHNGVIIGSVAVTVAIAIVWFSWWGIPRAEGVRRFLVFAFWPALIFAISYASSAALQNWIDLFHRGETLGPASDYLRGKRPFSDVFVLHGMLEDGLLDSWLMQIFGRSAEVSMMRAVAIGSLALPALFILAFAMFDSIPLALGTVAVGMFTFVDNPRVVLQLATATLLVAAFRWSRRWAAVVAGVVTGVAIFYSLDIGLYSAAASIVALLVLAFLERGKADRFSPVSALLLYLAGFAIGVAPFAVYLLSIGSMSDFLVTSFSVVPGIIDAAWSLPFPDLASTFRDLSLRALADFVLGEKLRFVLNPLVLAITITVLIGRWRRGSFSRLDALLVIVTMSALFAQRSALGRADFQHQHFAAFLLPPILVALALLWWRRLPEGGSDGWAFRTLAGTAAAVVMLVVLWLPDLLSMRLDSLIRYRPRISGIGYEDRQAIEVRDRIALVSKEIRERTRANEPIFDFSNQPAFYFFADRPNPTPFYQVPVLSPARLQLDTIRRLEQSMPRLVLRGSPERYDRFDGISNDVRAPAVARYIRDHYELASVVRGVELWERRKGMKPARPEQYARYVRVPSKAEEMAEEKLIFPAVGSVEGAGGSRWAADLNLYNMFSEPLQLFVRYEYADGTTERELTLESQRALLVKDVVGGFLARPQTRGKITIAYPAERRPVLTLSSYDSNRAASRFVEAPLSSFASASAKTVVDTLTILGIAGSETRRVNVGVVNTGLRPARFKIVPRAPDGSVVGEMMESAIDENGSFLLVDAAPKLGTPFNGDVAIQIEMIEGTAVAYASVVDGLTGAHQTIAGVPTARR